MVVEGAPVRVGYRFASRIQSIKIDFFVKIAYNPSTTCKKV